MQTLIVYWVTEKVVSLYWRFQYLENYFGTVLLTILLNPFSRLSQMKTNFKLNHYSFPYFSSPTWPFQFIFFFYFLNIYFNILFKHCYLSLWSQLVFYKFFWSNFPDLLIQHNIGADTKSVVSIFLHRRFYCNQCI